VCYLRVKIEPSGMRVAERPSSRMRIEEERGDLLIDILKNLLQRGQCVLKNMPRIGQRGAGEV
jgi:hypothetical protein